MKTSMGERIDRIGRRGRIIPFLAALLLLGGCAPKAILPGVNMILITIDTLRADHLVTYGYQGGKTPNIDRLARDGTLFLDAYASVPLTLPSHTSYLTGTNPTCHGVHDNGAYTLGEEKSTIAEYLSDAGYETAAIVSSFQLDRKYGLSQGFDFYDDEMAKEFQLYDPRLLSGPKSQELKYHTDQQRAEAAVAKAKKWFGGRDETRPFFLWLHFFDPHSVYDPPPPYNDLFQDRAYPDSLYDGEIAYLDHNIGELVRFLRDKGLYDNTLIVFVADHGEGLGQHRELFHDQFIYDSTLHVPYIFGGGAVPGDWPPLVDDMVRSIDVLPTLLDLVGIRPRDDVEGESLLPLLEGGGRDVAHYIESYSPTHNLCVKLFGVKKGGWKYIEAPTPELYHTDTDPGETVNLADRNTAKAEELREVLKGYMVEDDVLPAEVDFETRRKLEAIGYVQQTARRVSMARENRADPKDMAACIEGLHMSMEYFNFGRFDSSLAVSLRLMEIFPGQSRIYYNIGNLQIRMGLYEDAVKDFRKILAQNPRYAKGMFWEGMALMRLKRDDEAIEWFRKAIAIEPNLQVARYNYAVVLARNGSLRESINEFEKALQIDSKSSLGQMAQAALTDIRDKLRAASDN